MWKLDCMNRKEQGWMGPLNLVENHRCRRLPFHVKMHQKRLAIGLRPDPLEEHSASPEPLCAIGGHGIEHSLAGIRGRCVAWTDREEQEQ
jgi:hypothetical protein